MHMTYKRMLRGATRMALSCLTLLGAMLPVACVYEQIPEAYDEADTYIHLNLISSETNTRGVSDEHQGTVEYFRAQQKPPPFPCTGAGGEWWRYSGCLLFEPFRKIVFTGARVRHKLYYVTFQGKQLQ